MLCQATEEQSTKYSRLTGVLWPGNKLLDCSTYEFNWRQKRTKTYGVLFSGYRPPLPGPGTFSPEDAKSALKVVNMTKTNYLMGMCPLFIGMEVRLSCVVQEPLLTREVPGIIRRIALHPKEVIPPDIGASAVSYFENISHLGSWWKWMIQNMASTAVGMGTRCPNIFGSSPLCPSNHGSS